MYSRSPRSTFNLTSAGDCRIKSRKRLILLLSSSLPFISHRACRLVLFPRSGYQPQDFSLRTRESRLPPSASAHTANLDIAMPRPSRSLFASLPPDLKRNLRTQPTQLLEQAPRASDSDPNPTGYLLTQPASPGSEGSAEGEEEETAVTSRAIMEISKRPLDSTGRNSSGSGAVKRRKVEHDTTEGHPWDCTGLVPRYQDYSDVPKELAKCEFWWLFCAGCGLCSGYHRICRLGFRFCLLVLDIRCLPLSPAVSAAPARHLLAASPLIRRSVPGHYRLTLPLHTPYILPPPSSFHSCLSFISIGVAPGFSSCFCLASISAVPS